MSSELKFLSLFWTFSFVSERPSLVWYWTRIHSAWQRWSSSWLAKGWVPWATGTLLLCCWYWKCVWTWRGWSSLSCLPVCRCQNCRNKCGSYASSGENWVTLTVIISNRARTADIFEKPATTGFLTKRRLWNERRNSILMTCHYPDLDSASDWLEQISHAARSRSG